MWYPSVHVIDNFWSLGLCSSAAGIIVLWIPTTEEKSSSKFHFLIKICIRWDYVNRYIAEEDDSPRRFAKGSDLEQTLQFQSWKVPQLHFWRCSAEVHGRFDQFHMDGYSSWEYRDGSVGMRTWIQTPGTHAKSWVWTHFYVIPALWKSRNSKITEACWPPAWL